jgi:hypothetical protein
MLRLPENMVVADWGLRSAASSWRFTAARWRSTAHPAKALRCELYSLLRVAFRHPVGPLEQTLGEWVQGKALAGHVAIDGKRLRGSATAQAPGTHLLAAFSARLQGVIGQLRVDPDANEITAALRLLKTLPLRGVTITGDAIFTQRAICKVIIDGGGDYFFTVKGNQPALQADIAQAFRPFSPLDGMVSTG